MSISIIEAGWVLAEVVVSSIVPNAEFNTLHKNIGLLNNYNVAPWVINYLHLLRVFGNEFAHFRNPPEPIPSRIIDNDFLMVLIAVENTLRFLEEYKQLGLV